MKYLAFAFTLTTLSLPSVAQTISEVWQTTWDRSPAFGSVTPSGSFSSSTGASSTANIVVTETEVHQSVWGMGGTLTESSSTLFQNLKSKNSGNYQTLMKDLFDITDGAATAGLAYVRVPVGSSDFSTRSWELTSSSIDSTLSTFDFSKVSAAMITTLTDIQAINPSVRIHVLAWSPPGWMKDSNRIDGGNFLDKYEALYAKYLLKVVQGFKSKGINLYAISVQNEVGNTNDSYPTCHFTYQQEAAVAKALRKLLDSNGFTSLKIIGMDHNWSMASGYANPLISAGGDAFAGVAFHCYEGAYTDIATFRTQNPTKEIYFTECTGSIGSDYWTDIKWWMDNLFIGSVEQGARSVLLWNLALDGSGQPELPGSNSCGGSAPCRGVVTINSSGSYTLNQEYYALAQASRGVTPKDAGGAWGRRVTSAVNGSSNWAFRVTAFETPRLSASDQTRYSLVAMNWNDGGSSGWNPQKVTATIDFRGKRATYTFPVGVTTLSWYADAAASSKLDSQED